MGIILSRVHRVLLVATVIQAADAAIDARITVVRVEAAGREHAALLTEAGQARLASDVIRTVAGNVR